MCILYICLCIINTTKRHRAVRLIMQCTHFCLQINRFRVHSAQHFFMVSLATFGCTIRAIFIYEPQKNNNRCVWWSRKTNMHRQTQHIDMRYDLKVRGNRAPRAGRVHDAQMPREIFIYGGINAISWFAIHTACTYYTYIVYKHIIYIIYTCLMFIIPCTQN